MKTRNDLEYEKFIKENENTCVNIIFSTSSGKTPTLSLNDLEYNKFTTNSKGEVCIRVVKV